MRNFIFTTKQSYVICIFFMSLYASSQQKNISKPVPFIEIGIGATSPSLQNANIPSQNLQARTEGDKTSVDENQSQFEDYSIKAGLRIDDYTFGFGYKTSKSINSVKWSTFIGKQFTNKLLFFNLKEFTTQIGPEFGMIITENPVNDYREKTRDWIQLGANLELYYNLKLNGNDTGFQIGANSNIFRGERTYRDAAKTFIDTFRMDVSVILRRNF